jgi:ribonucleoside-diphosphate reductase alpha chain
MDLPMRPSTRFTDPDAVEAWDALFRWREGERLRDTTVEQTWERVTRALAHAEGAAAEYWADRFAEQFRQWSLLPDERLLRIAGTQANLDPLPAPAAALNVVAFVLPTAFSPPRLQRAALVEAAALAVRMLDNVVEPEAGAPPSLHIGLIGVTDALRALGAQPESEAAAAHADDFGQALCEGCLAGAVELAIERGARARADADFVQRWRRRGVPGALLQRAETHGLRFAELTALLPHPALARLANGVQDGVDWQPAGPHGAAREHLRQSMQHYFDSPIPN